MKRLFAALTLTACTLTAAPFLAQAGDAENTLSANPGYLDFALLAADYGEPRVMVNLNGSLLRLASALPHDDPATAETLRNLDAVRIHVYDTHGDTGPAAERMQSLAQTLGAANWENIVRVREDGELVDIYLKQDGEHIQGVTIMAVDGEETVFVNVLGDIDPARLNEVVSELDIDIDLSVAEY